MIGRIWPLLLCFGLLWPSVVLGHELMPGYLELEETSPHVYDVIWKLPLQRGTSLPLAPRFPEDCATEGSLMRGWNVVPWFIQLNFPVRHLQGRLVSIDGLRAVGTEVLLRVTSLNSSGPETTLIQPEKGRP